MIEKISKNIDANIQYIKDILRDNDDLVIRNFEVGEVLRVKMSVVYIDGLINKDFISQFVIGSLMREEDIKSFTLEGYKTTIFEAVQKHGLYSSEIKDESKWDPLFKAMLSGDTLLFVDGCDKAIIVGSRGFPSRSIGEPQTETVIRGPRDGFTEVIKFNTTLIRRRIRDTSLRVKMYSVGRRSQTDVAVMYIEDIANKELVEEVKRRIEAIDIDAIVDSTILENLIEDNYLSPFPQVENTERPDSVAAALYEGRVAIVVDNSPFVLIVPATVGTLMQSAEDHYTRWIEVSVTRIMRHLGLLLLLLSGPLYVALTAYHPGLLPTKLSYFLAASRNNVPFPAIVEAALMEITMELLREGGTRISGPISTTIGIVGGLIIGQAAVEAGIVSPLMIIVVAITTVATFVIPSYEYSAAFRMVKFVLFLFSGFFGLYGITIGVILVLSHLAKLNSFGIPYTSPYSGLGVIEGDLKDVLVKVPVQKLWLRPGFTKPRDKQRMRLDKYDEKRNEDI
ncbi:MAG: spore germination protein [Tissierellia bacterium]|nr:spore germination protein [Tissierellia bacterium]